MEAREERIHLKRTGQIARVLAKHGLYWLSQSHSPWRYVAGPRQWPKKDHGESQPVRLRMALEELGPTYIKLGQAISTRTDLLPPEYIDELSKLQDSAKEFPYSDLREVVVEELGGPPERLFAEFCREPEAAASLSQVHRAKLWNGNRVVVKVQRPDAKTKVEEDLLVLHDFASFLTHHTDVGRQYDFLGWLDEFAFSIRNELDFRREARNADRIRENFCDDPDLKIPDIYWDYTTTRVLVMEEVDGIKITDAEAVDAMGVDRHRLSLVSARIVFTEVFKFGLFHADPHPGNFFLLPGGRLAIIDFGMVAHLDEQTRDSVMRMTVAFSRDDVEGVVDELLVLGAPRGPINRQDLRLDMAKIMQTFAGAPPNEVSLAQLLNETLATASRNHIHVQSDLLFLAKTIAMSEGISRTLDPTFNVMDHAQEFVQDYFAGLRDPKLLKMRIEEGAIDLADMALTFPRRSRRILGQLERGEIVITSRLENTTDLLNHAHAAANRLAMSMIIASLIVGMSFVASRTGARGNGEILIQIMLGLAILGGIGVLVSIWKTGKRT